MSAVVSFNKQCVGELIETLRRFGREEEVRHFLEMGELDFVSTSTYAGVATFEVALLQIFEEFDKRLAAAGLRVGPLSASQAHV